MSLYRCLTVDVQWYYNLVDSHLRRRPTFTFDCNLQHERIGWEVGGICRIEENREMSKLMSTFLRFARLMLTSTLRTGETVTMHNRHCILLGRKLYSAWRSSSGLRAISYLREIGFETSLYRHEDKAQVRSNHLSCPILQFRAPLRITAMMWREILSASKHLHRTFRGLPREVLRETVVWRNFPVSAMQVPLPTPLWEVAFAALEAPCQVWVCAKLYWFELH